MVMLICVVLLCLRFVTAAFEAPTQAAPARAEPVIEGPQETESEAILRAESDTSLLVPRYSETGEPLVRFPEPSNEEHREAA